MAYRIEFLPEAAREFEALDGSLKKIAAKQIDKLAANPELGEPFGNRMGIDLTGYRKAYFGKKAYRIVYEIQRAGWSFSSSGSGSAREPRSTARSPSACGDRIETPRPAERPAGSTRRRALRLSPPHALDPVLAPIQALA